MDSPHQNQAVLPIETDANEGQNGQNITKIRDILFGTEMRKNDNRFEVLEAHLAKEVTYLRDHLEQRMRAVETLVEHEFETLATKLQLEKKERQANLLAIETSLKKTNDLLEQRLADLENKNLDEVRTLRHQAHTNMETLRQNLHQLREETQTVLEKELDMLRKTKIDKASIASLFNNDSL